MFGQDRAAGEFLYTGVRGVENHAVVIRCRGQQKTAGQRQGFLARDLQKDFFRQHGRRLLIAQYLAGQFDVAQPFEILLRQPVGLAQLSPETGQRQCFGEKQRSYGCRHRRVSLKVPLKGACGLSIETKSRCVDAGGK
ncbi:hypothetical protein D3C73_406000 [compost metagenome]